MVHIARNPFLLPRLPPSRRGRPFTSTPFGPSNAMVLARPIPMQMGFRLSSLWRWIPGFGGNSSTNAPLPGGSPQKGPKFRLHVDRQFGTMTINGLLPAKKIPKILEQFHGRKDWRVSLNTGFLPSDAAGFVSYLHLWDLLIPRDIAGNPSPHQIAQLEIRFPHDMRLAYDILPKSGRNGVLLDLGTAPLTASLPFVTHVRDWVYARGLKNGWERHEEPWLQTRIAPGREGELQERAREPIWSWVWSQGTFSRNGRVMTGGFNDQSIPGAGRSVSRTSSARIAPAPTTAQESPALQAPLLPRAALAEVNTSLGSTVRSDTDPDSVSPVSELDIIVSEITDDKTIATRGGSGDADATIATHGGARGAQNGALTSDALETLRSELSSGRHQQPAVIPRDLGDEDAPPGEVGADLADPATATRAAPRMIEGTAVIQGHLPSERRTEMDTSLAHQEVDWRTLTGTPDPRREKIGLEELLSRREGFLIPNTPDSGQFFLLPGQAQGTFFFDVGWALISGATIVGEKGRGEKRNEDSFFAASFPVPGISEMGLLLAFADGASIPRGGGVTSAAWSFGVHDALENAVREQRVPTLNELWEGGNAALEIQKKLHQIDKRASTTRLIAMIVGNRLGGISAADSLLLLNRERSGLFETVGYTPVSRTLHDGAVVDWDTPNFWEEPLKEGDQLTLMGDGFGEIFLGMEGYTRLSVLNSTPLDGKLFTRWNQALHRTYNRHGGHEMEAGYLLQEATGLNASRNGQKRVGDDLSLLRFSPRKGDLTPLPPGISLFRDGTNPTPLVGISGAPKIVSGSDPGGSAPDFNR